MTYEDAMVAIRAQCAADVAAAKAEAECRGTPKWYVMHCRDGSIRDAVWYVGPFPTEAAARESRALAVAARPIRPGPNGPIDDVRVLYCTLSAHADRVAPSVKRKKV